MNLKKIIREEIDDMWQNLLQGEPNMWLSYQMIIFDEAPTEEEVIKLIRDAFKSGILKQEAIDSWENEGIEDEVRIITSRLRETPYLRIDLKDGWLYYGSYGYDISKKYPELRIIKYSEVKDYLINESEEGDDFAWVNDIENEIKFKKGERVRIHNMGDEDAFINWLGMYARNYKNGVYGKNIEGTVEVDKDSMHSMDSFKLINIKSSYMDNGDEIYFPYQEKMEDLQSKPIYKGLNLIYEPI
jgi:hypothetical protein